MMWLDLILVFAAQASAIAASSALGLDHDTQPCDERPPAIIHLDSRDCNGASCKAGELCVLGSCVALYSEDSHTKCGDNTTHCAPGQRCNAGDCYPIEILPNPSLCSATNPCKGGEICSNGICYPINTGGDSKNCGPKHKRCGPGTTCHRTSCVPLTYGFKDGVISSSSINCGKGRPCEPGSLCVNDKCHALTMHDQSCKSCSYGTLCHNGECIPIQLSTDLSHCSNNSHCSEDDICISGVCTGGWDNPCRDAILSSQDSRSHKGSSHVSPCLKDKDCSNDEMCWQKRCTSTCNSKRDCKTGQNCWENRCTARCYSNGDCILGYHCRASNHVCIPSPRSCRTISDCDRDEDCLGGSCVVSCASETTCDFKQACWNGYCTSPCHMDRDCSPLFKCDEESHVCIPSKQLCDVKEECGKGMSCRANFCTQSCNNDHTCGFRSKCKNGYCVSSCVFNTDCPNGQRCSHHDGTCKPKICQSNSECPSNQRCFKDRCTSICEKSSNCPQGEICYNTYVCGPPRDGCMFNDDCPLGDFCNSQNVCELIYGHHQGDNTFQGCSTTWPGCERPHSLPFDVTEDPNTNVEPAHSEVSAGKVEHLDGLGS